MKNDFLKFPATLTIIVLVATAGLSKVYLKTKDVILAQERRKVEEALQRVVSKAAGFTVQACEAPVDSYWVGSNDQGGVEGFAFLASSRGYSSEILCMVGVDTAGHVSQICILSQQETPGLGVRVEELTSTTTLWNPRAKKADGPSYPWFQEQFTGIDATRDILLERGQEWCKMPEEARKSLKGRNAVTALTGATISSEAVLQAVTGRAGVVLAHNRARAEKQLPSEPDDDVKDGE